MITDAHRAQVQAAIDRAHEVLIRLASSHPDFIHAPRWQELIGANQRRIAWLRVIDAKRTLRPIAVEAAGALYQQAIRQWPRCGASVTGHL